jgi:hypothetical protein
MCIGIVSRGIFLKIWKSIESFAYLCNMPIQKTQFEYEKTLTYRILSHGFIG